MEGIPEGTPREAIAARYEQETGRAAPPPSSPQSAPKADGPGFMERSEKRLQMGLSDAMSTLAGDVWNEDATPKHQTPVDVARRVGGGDIGSAVFDVAGDALISAGKEILPAAAQRALGDTMDKAMNLEPVKAGIEAWDKFEKGNPEIARKINETANVAGLLAPTPKTPKVSAQAYGRKSLDTKIKGRSEEVRNILQPDATAAKGHIEEVGALGRNRYVGTQFEEGMYDTVAKVKGVDPRKSYAHNWKALQDESTALRKSLDARLREGGSAVEVDGLKKGLANVANAFGRNPLLAGKADSAANQVYLAT